MIGKAEMARLAALLEKLAGEPFTCSMASSAAKKILGGEVMGYWSIDNPSAQLGRNEGGHDFLLVEGVILDIWGMAYQGTPLILDPWEDARLIQQLYGDSSKWEIVE